jgi:8-oxo-dGTP pyrophosphatase MutT (NUDIX family)
MHETACHDVKSAQSRQGRERKKLGMWQSYVGAGTLVVLDNRVLMVCRERSGRTRWELPSGLLEAGESLEQTAVRETLEETGIDVETDDLLCTTVITVPTEEYRAINAYFLARVLSILPPKVLTRDEPIKEAAFIDVATLDPRHIHPVDRRILQHWRRRPHHMGFHLHVTL